MISNYTNINLLINKDENPNICILENIVKILIQNNKCLIYTRSPHTFFKRILNKIIFIK